LVELYQDGLVARGAIGPDLDTRGWTRAEVEAALEPLQRYTGAAFERFEDDFTAALQAARDLTGLALARCVQRLDANDLDFPTVAARFCEALVELGEMRNLPAFVENFLYRDIDPRPLLGGATVSSGATWAALPPTERLRRVAAAHRAPAVGRAAPLRDPLAAAAVGRLIQHPHRETAALAGG
jgi:hypothetical protein